MDLPLEGNLEIPKLARVFRNTSATYKFYWFLAILEEIEQGHEVMKKEDLFIRMLSIPWYTVNYFNLSFGRQDLIQRTIRDLREVHQLAISTPQGELETCFRNSSSATTRKLIFHFDKNVPHWFLSPWFPGKNKRDIYQGSHELGSGALYALYPDYIRISPLWHQYLETHLRLLKDYCYWNLALFLQTRNPNVPDIPSKLIKPAKRNSLNSQRRNYWDHYLEKEGEVSCMYTGKPLNKSDYVLDHFVPYAFVSHDLIWNLVPIDPGFNLQKSDKLPNVEQHFNSFFQLQKEAYFFLNKTRNINRFREDFFTIFPRLKKESDFEKDRFKNLVTSLISVAENNGFEPIQ